jgi:5-methylcytosine-specific restriction endonuclease McrA
VLPTETLYSLVEEYKTVERVADFLGLEKCVLRAYIRQIPELNKEVQRIQQAPYRKRGTTVESTPQYKKRLRCDPCAYCGNYSDTLMTIDHVIPTARGGENHMDNMTSACRECNARKADTTLLMYLLQQRED